MVMVAVHYHGGEEMSRRTFRRLSPLKLLVSIAALAAVVTAISCISLGESDESADKRFYGYFVRDQKAMEDMGLPVYWLGREFTAGGLTFRGPHAPEFGGEVEDGRLFMGYSASLDAPFEGTNIGLEITVYSPDAWQLAKDRILNPRVLSTEGEVTRRTVTVSGRQAEFISIPGTPPSRPVARLRLVVDLDPVVVVAEAASNLSSRGGGTSELSVFIKSPDLFVQVMQDLRPYPE
jgi:hypothetical protein